MWCVGEVSRAPTSGRVDGESYLYGIDAHPRVTPNAAESVDLVAARWFMAHGPATAKEFAAAFGIAAGARPRGAQAPWAPRGARRRRDPAHPGRGRARAVGGRRGRDAGSARPVDRRKPVPLAMGRGHRSPRGADASPRAGAGGAGAGRGRGRMGPRRRGPRGAARARRDRPVAREALDHSLRRRWRASSRAPSARRRRCTARWCPGRCRRSRPRSAAASAPAASRRAAGGAATELAGEDRAAVRARLAPQGCARIEREQLGVEHHELRGGHPVAILSG